MNPTPTDRAAELNIGDKVRKPVGYPFPGIVVAKFTTTAGALRYVVECTVPECKGMLHIYGPSNIEAEVPDGK